MKLTTSLFILILLSLPLPVRSQGFDWAWEKGAEGEGEKAAASAGIPADETAPQGAEVKDPTSEAGTQDPEVATPGESGGARETVPDAETFKWTPEADEESLASEVGVAEPALPPAAESGTASRAEEQPAAANTGADSLLKENLELRRKIVETTKAEEEARKENEQLTAGIKDMERKNAQFAVLISDLEGQKKASDGNPAREKELEARLAEAEQERAKQGEELQRLRQALDQEKETAAVTAPQPAKAMPAGTESVKPGSDLFKDTERQNLLLKNKLVEIEEARLKAVRDREELLKKADSAQETARQAGLKQKQMEEKLAAATAAQKETGRTLEKLMAQIPALEKELSTLKNKTTTKDSTLTSKERDLQAMAVELEKRERRLIKAERMTTVLEKTREEVAQISDRERRDMHYNMAVVYAKEGKLREAESEYLRSLRIDPNDAAVHYNLGILYDDELNDKEKAAIHYRKYLKLNPHGADVDAVKGWLLKIDMGQ